MKTYHSEECKVVAKMDSGSFNSDNHDWQYRFRFTNTEPSERIAVAYFDDWDKTAGAALCLVGELLKDGKLKLVR
jgi:hypothetical protein